VAPDEEEKTAVNSAEGTGEEKTAEDTGEGAGEKGPTRSRRREREGRRDRVCSSAADAAAANGAGGSGRWRMTENWDLCLVVDPVTKDQEAAQTEVESFFTLLRKEGLMITDPLHLDPNAGFTGKVMALCTASQVQSAFVC